MGLGPQATAPVTSSAPDFSDPDCLKKLSDELPFGWEAARDYSTNRVYYRNRLTQTTTFDSPLTNANVDILPSGL